MSKSEQEKPLFWIGSSLADLKDFPDVVQNVIGYALDKAQQGGKSPIAKPLQGFSGAGVLEVVDDFDGDTYRTVYTVRFSHVVYVLHAFQKKSHKGIATRNMILNLSKPDFKGLNQITRNGCYPISRAAHPEQNSRRDTIRAKY